MNATRRALSLALIPFALGLAAALLLQVTTDRLPIIHLRADLGTWLALLGGLLSLLTLTGRRGVDYSRAPPRSRID